MTMVSIAIGDGTQAPPTIYHAQCDGTDVVSKDGRLYLQLATQGVISLIPIDRRAILRIAEYDDMDVCCMVSDR
jgi:hypothetical protein